MAGKGSKAFSKTFSLRARYRAIQKRPTKRSPDPSTGSGTAGGARRVFKQFLVLKAGSVKAALSRPPAGTPLGKNTLGALREASRWVVIHPRLLVPNLFELYSLSEY